MVNEDERKKISAEKKKAQMKFEGRLHAEESNPCLKEQELTYNCLNRNNYDNDACRVYFENYKTCKFFWNKIQRNRRQQNITPALPPPEEREKIKAEHWKL